MGRRVQHFHIALLPAFIGLMVASAWAGEEAAMAESRFEATYSKLRSRIARHLEEARHQRDEVRRQMEAVAADIQRRAKAFKHDSRLSLSQNGTVHHFKPAPAHARSGSNPRELVYINGMLTPYAWFRRDAQLLADVTARPVTGVYAGGWTHGLPGTIVLKIENWTSIGPALKMPEGKALKKVLADAEAAKRKVDLVCHSRGSMITKSVVAATPWAKEHVTVYAFGTPVTTQFPVESYHKIINKYDLLMKVRAPKEVRVVWGKKGGHDFEDYMANLRDGAYDADLSSLILPVSKKK
jgi:hypothetical protein